MAAKMSQKMERTLDYILSRVEEARTKTFDEWLEAYNRYTLDDHVVCYLRSVYAENKDGIVRGMYDGRTLNALEKRGYLRYFDDLEQEKGNWIIRLTEDEEAEEQTDNDESEAKDKAEATTENDSTETDIADGQKSDDGCVRYVINNPDRGKWDVYKEHEYDAVNGSVNILKPDGYRDEEQYAIRKERLRGIRIARFKTRKAAKAYIASVGGIVGRVY